MNRLVRQAGSFLFMAAGYGLLIYFGLASIGFGAGASPFWPAAGFVLGLFYRLGAGVLPGLWLVATLVLANTGLPLFPAVLVGLANVAVPAIAGILLRRNGFRQELERNEDVMRLGIACALAPVLPAVLSATMMAASGNPAPWWDLFGMLWKGDGLGLLVVAPVLLALPSPLPQLSRRRLVEALALACVLLATVSAIFLVELRVDLGGYASAFLLFPFFIWAAMRFGPIGAALTSLTVAFGGYMGTAIGQGPFAGQVIVRGEFRLGVFMAVATMTSLFLASMNAERQRMQGRLAQSQRLASLGTLAAGVAHEINNPLAFLSSNLQYIADNLGGRISEASLREAIDDSLEGANRIRDIVSDLGAFSLRGGERKAIALDQPVDLAVRMAANGIRPQVRLEVSHAPSPIVLADAGRIGQVVLNLVMNAAQALPLDGEARLIRISTGSTAGGRAFIEIRDAGSGIPAELLPRLFEPFFTTKPLGQGMGLGLSIAHEIVAAHAGELRVESKPGKGTTVRVLLPPQRRASNLLSRAGRIMRARLYRSRFGSTRSKRTAD